MSKKLDKNAGLANILSLFITRFINSSIQEHGCLSLFIKWHCICNINLILHSAAKTSRLCHIIYISGSREFSRWDPTMRTFFFLFFFLIDEGREDPYATISWPSLVHVRNAISMSFRWRAYDGQTLNTG